MSVAELESAILQLSALDGDSQVSFLESCLAKCSTDVLDKVQRAAAAKAEEQKKKQAAVDKPKKKKRGFVPVVHPKCVVCGKSAYAKESTELAHGNRIHIARCLKCMRCGTKLNLKSYVSAGVKVYCRPCHMRPEEAVTPNVVGAQSNELSQNTVDYDVPDAEFTEQVQGIAKSTDVFENIASDAKADEIKERDTAFQTGRKVVIENNILPVEYLTEAEDVNLNGNTLFGRANRITSMSEPQKRKFLELFEILGQNRVVKSLTMAGCGLDNWCAGVIAKFIAANTTLIFVNLDNNYISSNGMLAIGNALKENNTLRAVTLQGQWKYTLTHDAADTILEVFKTNTSITQFGFSFALRERQIAQNEWLGKNNDRIRVLRKELRKKVAEIEHLLTVKFF